MHHIITDGISLNIFIKEFVTLYADGKLPILKYQYKDFSQWQDNLVNSGEIKKQENYWLQQFQGGVPQLNLPTDYERSESRSNEGDHIKFEIDRELTKKIKQIALESELTLAMVLLAAYNILLSKYSGQEDIVVGLGISGRSHAGMEKIVGMFPNMLALRNHPMESKTVTWFFNEVKNNAVQAYENQDYQFEELVKKLALQRMLGRNPIFDVSFVFQNIENINLEKLELQGLILKPFSINARRILKFDLTFLFNEYNGAIHILIEFSKSLFKRSTVEKMAENYIETLKQLEDYKDIKIGDIKISHDFFAGKLDISQQDILDFDF
jgi:hypothetical protein